MVPVIVVAVVTVTYAINTLKIRMVAGQRVWQASLLEAAQGLAFVYGMLGVLEQASGWLGTAAYVVGAGSGTLVTMLYERRRGSRPAPPVPVPHRHACCPAPRERGSTVVAADSVTRSGVWIDTTPDAASRRQETT